MPRRNAEREAIRMGDLNALYAAYEWHMLMQTIGEEAGRPIKATVHAIAADMCLVAWRTAVTADKLNQGNTQ